MPVDTLRRKYGLNTKNACKGDKIFAKRNGLKKLLRERIPENRILNDSNDMLTFC